ncbi:MAG: SH3 domain-containing protein [Bdellovibrionota bacterium]
MKTWPFIKCAFFLNILCLSAKEVPYLLEVKKDTPLFVRPSIKSKQLAQAEEGTVLLYLEKSKRSIWVKLRSADGLVGWMPISRTDYKEVESARSSIEEIRRISRLTKEVPDKKNKSREEMISELSKAQGSESFRPFLRIAPLQKWTSDAEPASSRMGLRVDYNLGLHALGRASAVDPAWASVEASLPSPFSSHSSDFSAAARYVWRAPLWGPFVYGPDMGYSIDKVRSDYRHHFSLGLASGLFVGPFDLTLRGAYDFFAQSRASVELQLGVSF